MVKWSDIVVVVSVERLDELSFVLKSKWIIFVPPGVLGAMRVVAIAGDE